MRAIKLPKKTPINPIVSSNHLIFMSGIWGVFWLIYLAFREEPMVPLSFGVIGIDIVVS
jgi:hypothetical protein